MIVRGEPLGVGLEKVTPFDRSAPWLSRMAAGAAWMRARVRGTSSMVRSVTIWNYLQLLGGSVARLADSQSSLRDHV